MFNPALLGKLPAFCRVIANLKPTPDSDINIEVWLPETGWNGKFQGVGNGGWGGFVLHPLLVEATVGGYAAAGTDTGHVGGNATFGIGHPEKMTDFNYRAVHEMTVAAKRVIAAFYGSGPKLSIWNACSTGGRQGIVEAVRYPEDYDGVIAGAPAVDAINLHAGRIALHLAVRSTPESIIPPTKYPVIHQAVLNACDELDGVKDGVLEDPQSCRFDPIAIQCTTADEPSCLTPPQVQTARRFYEPVRHPATGEVIMRGLPRGSELGWQAHGSPQPQAVAFEAFKYVFGDPKWDPQTFDLERALARAETFNTDGAFAANDTNLKPFFDRGGKLLMYHGWRDAGVPPSTATDYFTRVTQRSGPSVVGASIQLYMVPGMDHCAGGPGTDTFDKTGVIERWIATGTAPPSITASRVVNGQAVRTRPLCPYGQVAKWDGTGSTDDAKSFSCVPSTAEPVR